MERYTKNHIVGLWSAPIPRDKVPPDTSILRAVTTFKIRKTQVDNIWDFYVRVCADGSPMKIDVDFDQSH